MAQNSATPHNDRQNIITLLVTKNTENSKPNPRQPCHLIPNIIGTTLENCCYFLLHCCWLLPHCWYRLKVRCSWLLLVWCILLLGCFWFLLGCYLVVTRLFQIATQKVSGYYSCNIASLRCMQFVWRDYVFSLAK